MVKLAGFSLSSDHHDRDEVSWKTKRDATFSAKSAYEAASGWADKEAWEGWRVIWKLMLQRRVKVFIFGYWPTRGPD